MKTKNRFTIIQASLVKCCARLLPMITLACFILSQSAQASETVVWSENFDDGLGDNRWFAETGVWQMGSSTNTNGPALNTGGFRSFSGAQCATTSLASNAAGGVDSRLIRIASFAVPAAGLSPRLRFWQWYAYGAQEGGFVEIKETGTTTWIALSGTYTGGGGASWTRPSLDLKAYAGKTVQIAFRIKPTGSFPAGGPGWYFDDVTVVTGAPSLPNPEGFESGLGDWSVENGTWQVGTPTYASGPAVNGSGYRTFAGSQCATTGLTSDYSGGVDSRLISPEFSVAAAGLYPRLRFWQWYQYGAQVGGSVEIREAGTTSWVAISGNYTGTGGGRWTRPSLDLRAYAGKTVQVAFRIKPTGSFPAGGPGWYLDDVTVVTGAPTLPNPEGFESGLGDWAAENGTWQVGSPTYASGPPVNGSGYRTFTGSQCATTGLTGDYAGGVDSRLISPEFVVAAAGEYPRLRFWQWYQYGAQAGGSVEVREAGTTSWVAISGNYTGTGGRWTRPSLDLRAYAGKTVQVAFRLKPTGSFPAGGPGWYLDDVTVVTGIPTMPNPEGFEAGLGDWSAENGTWQVGAPTSGPGSAYSGVNCAATILDGNYSGGVNTRLISPEFTIPVAAASPGLRFRHWYQFGAQVSGVVELKAGVNDWVVISPSYTGSSGAGAAGWVYPYIDLTSYAGQSVKVAFHIQPSGSFPSDGPGWYIDNVTIQASVIGAIPNATIDEQVLWTYTPTITGTGYTFSLQNAPSGMLVDAGTGVITWTPTEAQGPGVYSNITLVATQAGSALAPVASQTFTATVNEVNVAPVVDAITNKTVNAGSLISIPVHYTDQDLPTVQTLTASLDSGFPSGMTITPVDNNNATIAWTPTAGQAGPTHAVTLRVTDNGTPALSSTVTFNIAVIPVNIAPVLTLPSLPASINELVLFSATATATDANPGDVLTFSLDTFPAGMTIGSSTGIISWTPTEAQGPGTYPITVRVTDNGSPTLSDTKSFNLTVLEVNSAPVLVGPATIAVTNPATVSQSYSATDSDLPANTLSFSKVSGPAWLTMNPSTGLLTGTPPTVTSVTNYSVTLRVTDNGSPPLFGDKSVTVTVSPAAVTNTAPILFGRTSLTITNPAVLSEPYTAVDNDVPTQTLTFSKVSGPAWVSFTGTSNTSALLSGTPPTVTSPTTYTAVIMVADNGTPPMSNQLTVSILVNPAVGTCFVNRHLLAGYVPGNTQTVTLAAVPPSGTLAYAVEDVIPTGWTVGTISDAGVYDSANHKVKFQFLSDGIARNLTYQITPPVTATGSVTFTGTASRNGTSYPVCGDNTLAPLGYHPADNNPANYRIVIDELTAYAYAWLHGDAWGTGPSPIDGAYVTRAGYLWSHGEIYTVDPLQALPLAWVPVAPPAAAPLPRTALATVTTQKGCWRILPPTVAVNTPTTVSVIVCPTASTANYAIEELPPSGWQVTNVSDGGVYDAAHGRVRWGLFTDHAVHMLSYDVIPTGGIAPFTGTVSFDGQNLATLGYDQPRVVVTLANPELTLPIRLPSGETAFSVATKPGHTYLMQVSPNLSSWTALQTTPATGGGVSVRDPGATGETRRYYRAIEQ